MASSAHNFVSTEQYHLLSQGRVPIRRKRLIQRKELVNKFCLAIREFANNADSHWFLVHGMPGIGKTQLVIELLWDKPEVCLGIFGRVIWLPVDGRLENGLLAITDSLLLSSLAEELDENGGGNQMENFLVDECQKISNEMQTDSTMGTPNGPNGGNRSRRPSRRKLGEKFRIELDNNGMVDTLLILDGIVDAETVRFVEEFKPKKCKMLATSTSRELFTMVDGQLGQLHMNGDELSPNELAKMAKCYGMQNADEFMDEEYLRGILAKTGGNLALLDKLFTMARGQQEIFDSLLCMFSKCRPLRHFNCHSLYPFANLEEPIKICIRMLDDYLRPSLQCCTALERHVWTPFELLSLIWPLDVCGNEVEAQMTSLKMHQLQTVAANSLIDCQQKCQQFEYRLHPLIHTFLLQFQSNAQFMQNCQTFLIKLRQRTEHGDDPIWADYLALNEQRLLDADKIIQQIRHQKGHHPGMNGKTMGRRMPAMENQNPNGGPACWNPFERIRRAFLWWPQTPADEEEGGT